MTVSYMKWGYEGVPNVCVFYSCLNNKPIKKFSEWDGEPSSKQA